jgi:hypothetical protein
MHFRWNSSFLYGSENISRIKSCRIEPDSEAARVGPFILYWTLHIPVATRQSNPVKLTIWLYTILESHTRLNSICLEYQLLIIARNTWPRPETKQEFWEEPIVCFPLIRHGPHRKRRLQQFFYSFVCIRCRSNVFAEPMFSNDRRHTDSWEGFVK